MAALAAVALALVRLQEELAFQEKETMAAQAAV
jgi:hypothetical protein